MTEPATLRTPCGVLVDALRPEAPAEPSAAAAAVAPRLADVFRTHHEFVWRSARRLGCPPDAIDDAVQEVFMIAARKLSELARPEVVKTWLFRATINVVRNHRRGHERRERRHVAVGQHAPRHAPDHGARYEAAEALLELLELLDEDRRVVFVLASCEQMTAPEISAALGVKLNTVYSRLRSARELLERAVVDRRSTP